MDTDQALFERIRSRLEQDADVMRWTDRTTRHQVLHRVAQLAAQEAHAERQPATWETARTRPLATPELDDPRDVLIGRLARVLDVADGGHHAGSYSALLAAAVAAARRKTL